MKKIRGDLFLNGNVINEADLIGMVYRHVLKPRTLRPELDETRKVLLVTAAWRRGHEFNDRHIIGYFEELGIDAGWRGAFPTNIQNLGLWSAFERFKHGETRLYDIYHEKQNTIKKTKLDYFLRNQEKIRLLFKDLQKFRKQIPALGLFDLFYGIRDEFDLDFFTRDLELPELNAKVKGIRKMQKSSEARRLARSIHANLEEMVAEDREVYIQCQRIEQGFFADSGIRDCALYQDQREEMRRRILSSASVFLFGGRVYVLNNRLRFYDLGTVFEEALGQGSNLYGISAGSIVMTDNFALNFEKQFRGGFLRAEDFGMGLVKKMWVFPHANDYRYITQADESMLSLFAIRHFPDVCVGLSCNSVLRCERYQDEDGKAYDRYSSYGRDPVLVFGVRGRLKELGKGDEIVIEGTRHFTGENMVYTRRDLERLDAKDEMRRLTAEIPGGGILR